MKPGRRALTITDSERICDIPVQHGPHKGEPARGKEAGYVRHLKRGESPCDACREGYNAEQREKRTPSRGKKKSKSKRRGEPLMTGLPNRRPTEPPFVGWKMVPCVCGERGRVNSSLLKRGQSQIDGCVNCK